MATVGNQTTGRVELGASGVVINSGQGVFATTFATTTIPVTLKQVQQVLLTPSMAPASDEILYVTKTGANGTLTASSDGTITIARTGASKTSALKFDYLIFGY